MNRDEIKKEVELQLKNANILDCKYVTVSVETLKYLKNEAFRIAKKPIYDKQDGYLCKECNNSVEMTEKWCKKCGCKLNWEAMFDECF